MEADNVHPDDQESTPSERLDEWYHKYEDTIIFAAIGISIAGLIAAKVINGKTVRSGDIAVRDDGAAMIILKLKNGKRQILLRKPAEKSPNVFDEVFGPRI